MNKRVFIFIFILIVVCLGYYNRSRIKEWWYGMEQSINRQEVTFLLREDISFDSLSTLLIQKGVLDDTIVFNKEVREQFLTDQTVDAGKYTILSATRIDRLVNGFRRIENGHALAEKKVNLVFNHCRTISDLAQNIAKCISADSASIAQHIHDQRTLDKYHFTLQQIPAMFIPDKYQIYYDTSAEEFIEFMAEQFNAYWNYERLQKMRQLGLSKPSQVVTLASIVYSEQAKVKDEWAVIARLYLNRLEKGMKLQSDPTFKFCWGNDLDGKRRLLAKHRDIECAYNTYKIVGLPPGPICLVSKSVLNAVLNPDTNDYLFMCAKPDYSGMHNFTHSATEHIKNARQYQKWLDQLQIH